MNVLRIAFAPVRSAVRGLQARAASTEVYSWGKGDEGQLGRRVASEKLPHIIESLSGQDVQQVAAGASHTLFVTGKGGVLACGKNTEGELGRGAISHSEVEPRAVSGLDGVVVKSVAAGGKHSLALAEDGTVFSWGFGGSFFQSGALGHGNKDTVLAAKPIAGLDKVKAIAAGEYHSLAVNQAGQVFSWGLGELGRLGHGDSAAAMTPKLVEWLVPEGRAIAVSAGLQFSAALLENGSIYMWGSDAAKQLGNGDGAAYDAFQEFPTKVRSLPAAVKAVRVACGHKHTAMLDSEGNVWVWGNVGSFLPKRVEGLSQVTDISSGSGAVFAITKDGSVLSFTTTRLTDIVRAAHPLGHDANTPNQPTVLATLKAKGKAVSVAAGTNHAVAVIAK